MIGSTLAPGSNTQCALLASGASSAARPLLPRGPKNRYSPHRRRADYSLPHPSRETLHVRFSNAAATATPLPSPRHPPPPPRAAPPPSEWPDTVSPGDKEVQENAVSRGMGAVLGGAAGAGGRGGGACRDYVFVSGIYYGYTTARTVKPKSTSARRGFKAAFSPAAGALLVQAPSLSTSSSPCLAKQVFLVVGFASDLRQRRPRADGDARRGRVFLCSGGLKAGSASALLDYTASERAA